MQRTQPSLGAARELLLLLRLYHSQCFTNLLTSTAVHRTRTCCIGVLKPPPCNASINAAQQLDFRQATSLQRKHSWADALTMTQGERLITALLGKGEWG